MSRKNAGFRIDGTFECDQTNECPFIKHAVEQTNARTNARIKELEQKENIEVRDRVIATIREFNRELRKEVLDLTKELDAMRVALARMEKGDE